MGHRFVFIHLTVYGVAGLFLTQVSSAFSQTNADKSEYTLFNPTPESLLRPFDTDRPSKTDVPFTVDAGHFQIESDLVNYTQTASGGQRTEILEAGSTMNFKVGLCNDADLQLILGNYVRLRQTSETSGQNTTEDGFGDTTLRLKLNLFGNDSGKLALALLPFVKFPTASGLLGDHAFEGGLNVPFAADLPLDFSLGAETGVGGFRNAEDSGYHAAFNESIILYHTLWKKLSGYAEYYALISSRADDPFIDTADLGLIYQLTPNLETDVNVAFGLDRAAPDYNFFCGVGWRF